MQGSRADGQQFESWGAMVESYRREKSQLPWDSAKVEPVRYRTQYQVTREHRAFNPVLQTYTDPQKEAQVAAEQRERALQTMNQARDRELRFAQRYDVVNHAPRVEDPSAARQAVTKTRIPDTRTPYDVVNHIDNSRKPWHDPRSNQYLDKPRPEGKRALSHKAARDFDIVSNRYVVDHEAQCAKDEEGRRQTLNRKYWQTHDYDPVAGVRVDEAEEREAQRQRRRQEEERGAREPITRMPPSYQYGEAAAYNVITTEIKSERRWRDYSSKHLRRAVKPVQNAFEARKREEGEAAQAVNAKRTMNRIAPERFGASVAHGFDIVTNEALLGLGAKRVHPARPQPRVGPWDELQQTASFAPHGTALPPRPAPSKLAQASSEVLRGHSGGGGSGGSGGGGGGGSRGSGGSSRTPAEVPRLPLGDSIQQRRDGSSQQHSVRTGGFS